MGFPLALRILPPFPFSWRLPQAEITRSRAGAVGVRGAFLFVFLPAHNSDAFALICARFIHPGGEGDVRGDTFTFVNCNQN